MWRGIIPHQIQAMVERWWNVTIIFKLQKKVQEIGKFINQWTEQNSPWKNDVLDDANNSADILSGIL